MPASLQAEYISNLQKKYGATASNIAVMFGVKPLTVLRHVERNALGVAFARGHCMSADQRAVWAKFINEELQDEAPTVEASAPVESCSENAVNPDIVPMSPASMNMTRVSLRFNGAIDINMVANSLRMILGTEPTGELEIVFSLS